VSSLRCGPPRLCDTITLIPNCVQGCGVSVFDKQYILDEIDRTASANGGKALGRSAFERETGIKEHDWLGRYWVRWSDAVTEAGYPPNAMQKRHDDEKLLDLLIAEIRTHGRFPTYAELKLRRHQDPTFPSHTVISDRGTQAQLAQQILTLCATRQDDYSDVAAILEPLTQPKARQADDTGAENLGYVYLLKVGKHYKIGRSNAFGRRERELAIKMPVRAETVHVITTDDPPGIEAYWHRRFADRRVRRDAEWFELNAQDVSAFKRRRFQ
jgi:hypothetical protein